MQNENPQEQNVSQRGKGKSTRPYCSYCSKPGHTRQTYWKLHGRPSRKNNRSTTHMVQNGYETDDQHADFNTLSGVDYSDYLQYQAAKQQSLSSGTSKTGNSFACLSRSSPNYSWILDSGASDHISSNQNLFSNLIPSSTLSAVTLANGSRTAVKGIGEVQLLPSMTGERGRRLEHGMSHRDYIICPDHNHQLPSLPPSWETPLFDIVHSDVWVGVLAVKVLRSDNAKEYLSSPFTSFMSSQGITHQTSCAYTPQQNGVAERKNRHLIETARTLLIHHHVPLRFWGDTVVTACYLINRMPFSMLQHQSPHSILFPGQNPYHLPLRVFGCTCFVHDHSPGNDKLQQKSIKYVFLGYSRYQKGYKCYDPKAHKCLISADVTFFETSPNFSLNTTNRNLMPQVFPVPIFPVPQVSLPDRPQGSPPPLQVYSRARPLANTNDSTTPDLDTLVAPGDSSLAPKSPAPVMPSSDAVTPPIAILKGIRTTQKKNKRKRKTKEKERIR
ncbi:PREDICTED: uncharacterized protein LOC109241850 [Nicotiana attenuata]|uniref:uncharacterized protein LOC109221419 n=1 Tax=Nicotiana attenuata TaxID=49451 RepID=UPI000904B05C|nr:PREDICTED: uncharacterized protein LOC109221419 [Nicotiana attenuata]XP_019264214.1 PREDICTED: uncharacterized protein LOC109241850 [Nicotiana attenuata]